DVAHQLDQRPRHVRRLGDVGRISPVTQHRPGGQHPDTGSRCAARPPTRHAARRPHTRRWAGSSMILILSGVRSPLAVLAALFDRLGRYEPAATIAGFASGPFTVAAFPEIVDV